MQLIKMLGLAALAALMALALVVTSSAIAESTLLCSTDPASSCNAITHLHETTLVGHQALVHTSIGVDVECDVLFLSTAGGVRALGAPQVILGNFTYSDCTDDCTITEQNGPAESKVLRLGHESADVTLEFLIHVDCGIIDCAYIGASLKATDKGPLLSSETNGDVTVTKQPLKRHGPVFTLCPKSSELTITTTPLSATYIGS